MMKAFSILLLALSIVHCQAQDTTIVLKTGMFTASQKIDLPLLKGWVYHRGHNPAWSNLEVNTAGWVATELG